ncbi:zf-HC2 domain-containing protein [Bengtsoniella intestinalis]|uniref:anti-sigma factor family protein n=1 Tax=Bengtsoniella intestinalis TaxID=3073143 RepID=UPI00391FA57A
MNTCASLAALLDGYIDGVLSPEEQVLVENHLKTCTECAQYVADILAIEADFPTVDDVMLPDNFTQSVMVEVANHPRNTKKSKKTNHRWQQFALPAVACLAMMVYVGSDLLPSQETTVADATSTTMSYSAAPEMSMAETAMESRGMTEVAVAEELFGDDPVYPYQQSQVGTFLDSFQATVLDDGRFAYSLSADQFAALMARVEPTVTEWADQDSYWVVVTLE